jgi:hypothetical protein
MIFQCADNQAHLPDILHLVTLRSEFGLSSIV